MEPTGKPSTRLLSRASLPLTAAWALLASLFAWAVVTHGWSGYQAGLAVFALTASALCLFDLRASVVLFVGCQALDAYGFITHVPFSLSVSRVVVVAVVAGAVLRWLLAKPRPKLEVRRSVTVWDLGILIFLAGAVASVPFSYSLPLSLVGIVHVAFLIGAYFVVSRAALSVEGRRHISTTLVAVGALSALVALGQAFMAGFPVEVLHPAEAVEGAASAVRASAFFDNPNTLALLLVLAVLVAAERVWHQSPPLPRALHAVAASVCLAAVGVTESRAALVGIVVGVLALAALLVRRTRDRLVMLAAFAVLFAAVLAIPGVGARAWSIIDFRSDASAMDRVYLAEVSVEMFADRPLTGVGIQAYRAAYPDYADPRVTIDPVTDGHQMPASVPAEVGVLGLLAEAVLAGALIYLLTQSLRAGHEPIAPAGLAAMSAMAVMALFNTFLFFESFWIAAALVGADFAVAHQRATGQE